VLNQALSNKVFAECADKAGLRPFIVTNRSMTIREAVTWNNILADMFEALAGALDWDGGPKAVDKFFSQALYPCVDAIMERVLQPPAAPVPPARPAPEDKAKRPKFNRQVHEGMLAAGLGHPRYDTKELSDGGFESSIFAKDAFFASGKGPTASQAKKSAMLDAMGKLADRKQETNAPLS
jgi:dsRNA-specific ribonuclease